MVFSYDRWIRGFELYVTGFFVISLGFGCWAPHWISQTNISTYCDKRASLRARQPCRIKSAGVVSMFSLCIGSFYNDHHRTTEIEKHICQTKPEYTQVVFFFISTGAALLPGHCKYLTQIIGQISVSSAEYFRFLPVASWQEKPQCAAGEQLHAMEQKWRNVNKLATWKLKRK